MKIRIRRVLLIRVSEKVTIAEINSWKPGEMITIKAQTGAGKSYFIKNNLYAVAKRDKKKILLLVHRLNCLDQFQNELQKDKKTNTIKLLTYQSIEEMRKKHEEFRFQQYDYIVCDEFHYFMSDAAFNTTTDISLKAILYQGKATRILMSATGNYMIEYLEKIRKIKTRRYEIDFSYDYIKSLNFFYRKDSLEKCIKLAIKNNKKTIFFINDAEMAFDLHRRYEKYTLFNCAKGNQYYKHVDKGKIENMLVNERFEELILITTSVMDTGVSINDDSLNHIVISEIADVGTLIQCIGRKRLNRNNPKDHLHLHIRAMSNKHLGSRKGGYLNKLKLPDTLKKSNAKDYTYNFSRSGHESNMIYDEIVEGETDVVKKVVNDLMYYKTKTNISEIDKMLSLGSNGYCKYISKLLDIDYKIVEDEQSKDKLSSYLDSIVGKRLDKTDQESLKEVFKKNDLKSRTLGRNTLNGWLKDKRMNYIISSDRSSKRVNGKPQSFTYWIVGKITY